MPRRWADSTKALLIDALIARDGPDCALSNAHPSADHATALDIDHKDPDGPTEFANLRLLCQTCNRGRRRPTGQRGINERERERQGRFKLKSSPTDQAKQLIPYADGSPEMAASSHFEIVYRTWVTANVPMLKSEAINAGAESVGCSTLTATRYLAKLTSSTGPLQSAQDAHGAYTIYRRSAP